MVSSRDLSMVIENFDVSSIFGNVYVKVYSSRSCRLILAFFLENLPEKSGTWIIYYTGLDIFI